jgi:hypothetical protein
MGNGDEGQGMSQGVVVALGLVRRLPGVGRWPPALPRRIEAKHPAPRHQE